MPATPVRTKKDRKDKAEDANSSAKQPLRRNSSTPRQVKTHLLLEKTVTSEENAHVQEQNDTNDMFIEKSGNPFLDPEPAIMVHCTSTDASMSKGIAARFHQPFSGR